VLSTSRCKCIVLSRRFVLLITYIRVSVVVVFYVGVQGNWCVCGGVDICALL